jgi:hypothetical protein
MKTAIKVLFAAVSIALITACGGGESGSDEYIAPGYGSIATNRITGSGAINANYSWQSSANSAAIDRCGAGCATVLEFGSYMCGALARGDGPTFGWASHSRKSNAEGDALSACTTRGGVNCVVVLSACNDS